MSSLTCPLCGLRYPAPPPQAERASWAETARRALSRMLGRAA